MNGLIPSEQRATVLSFDNLMGSAGGVAASRRWAEWPTSMATPIVRGVCGDPGGGAAVPDAGPAGKSGVGWDRGGETEGRRGGDWPVGITYRRSAFRRSASYTVGSSAVWAQGLRSIPKSCFIL